MHSLLTQRMYINPHLCSRRHAEIPFKCRPIRPCFPYFLPQQKPPNLGGPLAHHIKLFGLAYRGNVVQSTEVPRVMSCPRLTWAVFHSCHCCPALFHPSAPTSFSSICQFERAFSGRSRFPFLFLFLSIHLVPGNLFLFLFHFLPHTWYLGIICNFSGHIPNSFGELPCMMNSKKKRERRLLGHSLLS